MGVYLDFARRLWRTGLVFDPWLDGRPRFSTSPLVLGADRARALESAAESVARVYDELCIIGQREPELIESFLGLTPVQARMWRASCPRWHGIARADVFMTAKGPVVCEINSDTPSGEAEAVLLNRVTFRGEGLVDPNASLEERFVDMIRRRGCGRTIGILYPTDLTEDLSMIALYQRWFASRGWRVVLGSPLNLRKTGDGGAALFGVRCDVFIRHYKTDWWAPIERPLSILLEAEAAGQVAIINPFGAVVTQNKRSMAFMWEHLDRFSPRAQDAIRSHVPFTIRLERIERLALETKDMWVLKSDYGCEGAEVVIGRDVGEAVWTALLERAIPKRWIAQRAFEPELDRDCASANFGVYLVEGTACGYFTRVQRGATDHRALSTATFIEEKSHDAFS
jgi:glutathionylspermidine synthase